MRKFSVVIIGHVKSHIISSRLPYYQELNLIWDLTPNNGGNLIFKITSRLRLIFAKISARDNRDKLNFQVILTKSLTFEKIFTLVWWQLKHSSNFKLSNHFNQTALFFRKTQTRDNKAMPNFQVTSTKLLSLCENLSLWL